MNVVTGQSDMNPKHFTPYEVNLMVLNRYSNVRQQLHTVIHLSNSGRKFSLKNNCRNIDLSLWGNISLSFPPSHCHVFSMFFIFCYLSEAVMFLESSISNTIHLSIKDNRRRTDSPYWIPSPTSCHYLCHPWQFYILSSVSFSSSSLLSCFILCYVVSSLAKPDIWLKERVWLSLQLILPKNSPLRQEKTVWLTTIQFSTWVFHSLWHCLLFFIKYFIYFLEYEFFFISSHSTVQLDSCGSADSGDSGSEDWFLPGHEQRGISLHLCKWLNALLKIDDYHN